MSTLYAVAGKPGASTAGKRWHVLTPNGSQGLCGARPVDTCWGWSDVATALPGHARLCPKCEAKQQAASAQQNGSRVSQNGSAR